MSSTRCARRWSTTSPARRSTGCCRRPALPPQPRLNGGTKGSHLIVDPFPGAPTDVVYYESPARRAAGAGHPLDGPLHDRHHRHPVRRRPRRRPLRHRRDGLHARRGQLADARGEPHPGRRAVHLLSGVRPLPYAPDKKEIDVPRSHVLHDHGATGLPGLVTVVGGKLTTYRQLAEDAVDDAFSRLGRNGRRSASPASCRSPARTRRPADRCAPHCWRAPGCPDAQVNRLRRPLRQPGLRTSWQLAEQTPSCRKVDPSHRRDGAELIFAVDTISPGRSTDVLARRVLLAFEPGHGLESVDEAAAVLAEHLGLGRRRRGGPDRRVPPVAGQTGRARSGRPAVGELRRRRSGAAGRGAE